MLYRRDRHSRTTIQRAAAKATGRGFGSSTLQANRSEPVRIYQIATYRSRSVHCVESLTPARIALADEGRGLSARELLTIIALTGWLWTQVAIDFLGDKLAAWNPELDR